MNKLAKKSIIAALNHPLGLRGKLPTFLPLTIAMITDGISVTEKMTGQYNPNQNHAAPLLYRNKRYDETKATISNLKILFSDLLNTIQNRNKNSKIRFARILTNNSG